MEASIAAVEASEANHALIVDGCGDEQDGELATDHVGGGGKPAAAAK